MGRQPGGLGSGPQLPTALPTVAAGHFLQLPHSHCPSLSSAYTWAVRAQPGSPKALSGPCMPPHPGLMETEPRTQRDRGPGPFGCIALQEFRSQERLGRGGATSGCGFKCVCFHSLLSPGPPSGPQGRKAALPTPAEKLGPPDPISPHLLLLGPREGMRLAGPTAIPSDLCWFPLSSHLAAGGPVSRTLSSPISGPPPGANT